MMELFTNDKFTEKANDQHFKDTNVSDSNF